MPAPTSYSGATSTDHDHNHHHHHQSEQHSDDQNTEHENEEQQENVIVNGNGNGNEDDDEEEVNDGDDDDDEDDDDDGGESSSSGDGESGEISDIDDNSNNNNGSEDKKGEFIVVRLSDIRKEVQCPICLGIIRKTRTVMECLHRFCRECIDKSMRMGNNECPACRTHCASRRSLRDDPNYDALIAALYPDIDQYEEEELAFQEDEKLRNKQIQDAIAQTFHRQTEALSRKRKRSQGNYRKRRNYQTEDDEYANGHDGGKDTSSADEHGTEVKLRRSKRCKGQPSDVPRGDGGVDQIDKEMQHRDSGGGGGGGGAPSGLVVGSPEMLAWGKGGMRSNTRYGGGSGGNGKHGRSRLAKLADHLRNSYQNDNEVMMIKRVDELTLSRNQLNQKLKLMVMDIQVVLVCVDEKKAYSIEHSYLCGRPALSVGQLCQFIAIKTSLSPEEVEILAVKGVSPKLSSFISTQDQNSSSTVFNACQDQLQVLNTEETLAGLKTAYSFNGGRLMLAYRQKMST